MNGRYRRQLPPFILRQAQDERKQLLPNGMFYICRSPYVNYAVLQTTPTADMKMVDLKAVEKVEGGVEIPGGSMDSAPRR